METKTITIKRAVRIVQNGKIEVLQPGKVVALPIPEANGLIAGNKAVAGEQKVEVPKKAEAPKK